MKSTPSWFDRPFGSYDQNTWDGAVQKARRIVHEWATSGKYDTYGAFVEELDLLDWPQGPFTAHGSQVGHLLGCVGIHDWLADEPLHSSLVVQADPARGKGLPGGGWFDFCRRLGLMADDKNEHERLRVWNDQVKACFAGEPFAYPPATPDWS